VLIHGAAQTAINWMTTPDRRQGWAEWFAEHGWQVCMGCSRQVHLTADSDHIADVPARRRCADSDSCGGANIQTNFSAPTTRMIQAAASRRGQKPRR
jgi:hypothetical protein